MSSEIRTQEEISQAIDMYAIKYTEIRFSQEIEMLNLKYSFKEENDNMIQLMREAGANKKFVDFCRCDYEKKLKLGLFNLNKVISHQDLAEETYNLLIYSFNYNTSNNSEYYKDYYIKAKPFIIEYYKKYYEIKFKIQELKNKQKQELDNLVQEIKWEGLAFYIIKDIYTSVRNDLKTKDESPFEFEYYKERRSALSSNILEKMEQIRAETLFDPKAQVLVEVTREEAIERIEFITNNAKDANYGILNTGWKKSRDGISGNNAETCQTILYHFNNNTKKYGSLTLWPDEVLTKFLENQYIRFDKLHIYKLKE